MVLLEGLARIAGEEIFAVNRIPGAVMDVQLRLFGITRNLGTAPAATVRFALNDALGHQINAGTRVALDLGAGVDPLVFVTDASVVAAPGALTLDAPVTATRSTAAANGVAVGTALIVLDPVAYVNGATVLVAPVGGVDPETTDDWRARGQQLFQSLRSTLVLPRDFTAEALNFPGVYRATTVDNWDPTLAGGAGGAANGHVTVAVLGELGVFLSGAAKADLEAVLAGKTLANLAVHVVDPTVTPVDVAVTVHRYDDWLAADVAANVDAALHEYLNTDAWDWSPTVRRNELLALVDGVDGVRYVEALTTPAADVALPGAAPLASAGSVAVTVNPA
jgi:uncharacterized phage protein gp47/JayE